MKKKILLFLNVAILVMLSFSIEAFAEDGESTGAEQEYFEQDKLISVINEILTIRQQNPEYTEEQIIIQMNERHSEFEKGRGVIDIWNALTDSEKKLCVRYPFDVLKVNTAKNIATSKTEAKFGFNGLGDRSDAFRHGIWNAEMTILIGEEKAELFATAHEDKDITGYEPDGYPKTAHRDMDLHNNELGRRIGQKTQVCQKMRWLILFTGKLILHQHSLYGCMIKRMSSAIFCTAHSLHFVYLSN